MTRTSAAVTLVGLIVACQEGPAARDGSAPADGLLLDLPGPVADRSVTPPDAGVDHAGQPGGPVYPLKLGPPGARYLVDQNGVPFFWNGDTAWSLIAQPTDAEARAYLDDRGAKGISVILVNLLEHAFADKAPSNAAGDAPFTGAAFSSAPNSSYFAHADKVIDAAAQRGVMVLLDPLYLGYECGAEGWCAEVKAASSAEITAYGQFLGKRYKSRDNILWIIGGDTDPDPVRAKMTALVTGILAEDTRHLMTAHNQPETYAVTEWPGASWLAVNSIYSYTSTIYERAATAYQMTPVMPFFQLESAYENEHGSTPQMLRAQAYWSVLGGAMGHTFGNCPIWHFGASSWCGTTDWKAQLNSPGSTSTMHLGRLMRSRAWHLLVPDWTHAVVTAGYGTYGGTDYVTTARTSDSATVMAYLPSKRQVTLDMTKVGGTQAKAWWFDPATGSATPIGTYGTSGTQTFAPVGVGDRVLVIDDTSKNLPPPGSS